MQEFVAVGEKVGLNSLIQRSSEPMQARLDDELVMMSVERGRYYGLDPVGSRIWELLDTPMTVDELIVKLMADFEVDRETCEKDTLSFLQSMHDEQLIEFAQAA